MDTDRPTARHTLHDHLEVPDIVVVQDKRGDLGVGVVLLQKGGGETALQAAGVVVEGVGDSGGAASGEGERGGAHVHSVVLEGPAGNAATAGARGQDYRGVVAEVEGDVALVGDVVAVAGHGGLGAVVYFRRFHCVDGVVAPVPVSVS